MFTQHDFWAGVLLPAVLAAAVLTLGWRATRHRLGARESRSAFVPLALGLGFAGGWLALFGRPDFPPIDSTDWLVFLALPLVVLGMLHSYFNGFGPLRLGLSALMVPVAVWLLARPVLNTEGAAFGRFAFTFASLLGIGWVLAMDQLADRLSARRIGLIVLAAMAPASIALVLAHSQRLMQTCGLLVAAQAGALVVTLVLGRAGIARGSMLLLGVLYGGVLAGDLYAGLDGFNALLLYLAPTLAWFAQPLEKRWGSVRMTLAQMALVAIPVAIVLIPLAIKLAARINEY